VARRLGMTCVRHRAGVLVQHGASLAKAVATYELAWAPLLNCHNLCSCMGPHCLKPLQPMNLFGAPLLNCHNLCSCMGPHWLPQILHLPKASFFGWDSKARWYFRYYIKLVLCVCYSSMVSSGLRVTKATKLMCLSCLEMFQTVPP
jgi:hypothetical protein